MHETQTLLNTDQLTERSNTTGRFTRGQSPARARLITELWARMLAAYPSVWRSQMGEVGHIGDTETHVARFWADELDSIEGKAILSGFKRMISAYPNYPPTLGQFVQLCSANSAESDIMKDILNGIRQATDKKLSDRFALDESIAIMRRHGYTLRTLPESELRKSLERIIQNRDYDVHETIGLEMLVECDKNEIKVDSTQAYLQAMSEIRGLDLTAEFVQKHSEESWSK